MINLSLFGSSGKMGQEVSKAAESNRAFKLLAPLNLEKLTGPKPDVVVDFSSADGYVLAANWCAKNQVPLVSGSTGCTTLQEKEIKLASKKIPLFWSPNMSLGLNCLLESLKLFSKQFEPHEVAIEEIHHKNKKDNPSGTAKLIHNVILQNAPKATVVSEPIGFRGGEVFGIHKVYFFSNGELITFEHQAINRNIFAVGALRAAKWIVDQEPGFYGMSDLLKGDVQ